ncbi:MAG: hypothetical protein Q8L21_02950, partial [Candidatus Komeilibacteria bacterium]|nr:hypothetical protein [Candidatus Komeilibacteria bacterium]
DSDLTVANITTSTVALAVGAGTINNLNMAGGDLYVQDGAEVDGDLFASGGTVDTSTGTATTTSGIFSRDRTNSTSTVSLGDVGVGGNRAATVIGCLEMAASDGKYYSCYINPADSVTSTRFVCQTGRCR